MAGRRFFAALRMTEEDAQNDREVGSGMNEGKAGVESVKGFTDL